MSSRADRGRIPALGGTNPDYYQETASIYGDGGSGDPNHRRRRRRRRDEHSHSSHHNHLHHHPSTPPVAPQPIQAPQPGPAYITAPPPPAYTYHNPHQPTTQPSQHQQNGSGRYSPPPPPKPPRPVMISHQSGSGPGSGPGSGAVIPTGPGSSPQSNNNSNNNNNNNKDKRTLSERLYQLSVKAGSPINKITNALGSEAFWPSTMDQECDKAARIIQSFTAQGASSRNKTLIQIPPRVLATCSGLAIFTVFRTGLHLSGSSGSGIVISRLPSGPNQQRWSPPSGFLIHSLGAGFLAGIDIYDCICVLRTPAAVRAFAERPRVSLGGDVGIVAGPVGAGAGVEGVLGGSPGRSSSFSDKEKEKEKDGGNEPLVYSYIRSRGLYAGVSMDGTVVVPRGDANAEFYGRRGITVDQILRGDVPWPPQELGRSNSKKDGKRVWPEGARGLMEALRMADQQGRRRERDGDHGGSSRKVDDDWAYEDRERDRRRRIDETPPVECGRDSRRKR